MKIANSLLFVAFVFGAATLLPAQVDAEHSITRFSVGSGPSAVEVGVGRVTGDVVFDASDATDPIVNLRIKPDKSLGADYSEISFKSKRSTVTNDGELAVVGRPVPCSRRAQREPRSHRGLLRRKLWRARDPHRYARSYAAVTECHPARCTERDNATFGLDQHQPRALPSVAGRTDAGQLAEHGA
jgi:hypothetical protein